MKILQKIFFGLALLFIPLAIILDRIGGVPQPLLFFLAAVAIFPLAALLVHATEQLATYTGDTIGGLLNATFGNAPELIIALVALKAGPSRSWHKYRLEMVYVIMAVMFYFMPSPQ